ncbi:hypothetical protein BCR41DRAFT_350888 [Lobosporangium transversale]|uniref:Secreted protein n=1 Tax=Lobosporangium transversale TaxID=64571 RepID=A0A1Y2GTI6_9FUNG|nr:hypothetical protein BCR41DRAFT_350888 [Lobosporangium transversale]ORZ21005.1 hypothetical protein BCR41DRAFT_350888 [Lobosporangium transversale]|eukprot:XP_021882914.1 hypothetical protein BCR41DRAFT_350888 [Lobosporangium transversale]
MVTSTCFLSLAALVPVIDAGGGVGKSKPNVSQKKEGGRAQKRRRTGQSQFDCCQVQSRQKIQNWTLALPVVLFFRQQK